MDSLFSGVDLLDQHILQVDYPLALEAPYTDVILYPGDMLYIPRWWWHYVTAVAAPVARDWEDTQENQCKSANSSDSAERLFSDDSTSKLCTQKGLPHGETAANVDDCYSFSVNFWWGDRRIKP